LAEGESRQTGDIQRRSHAQGTTGFLHGFQPQQEAALQEEVAA
jgi:hypothetical protein